MGTAHKDVLGTRQQLGGGANGLAYYALGGLEKQGIKGVDRLPVSVKVLLESLVRHCDGYVVKEEDVVRLAGWAQSAGSDGAENEVAFHPARVVLQDFTGVPAVVDLAACRDACKRLGGDPKRINPLVQCDLVIDHSVQVDYFGRDDALERNLDMEFERNRERYEFLKWGQGAFDNFSVVPPGMGIVHQVNLEYLGRCVLVKDGVALPDSLVGTDSHTTMINGLGVVGWGVGGIEAEAVMLGQPIYMLTPKVVGFKLTGRLREGSTATDLVLTVTQILRKMGVVDQFVEFYGDGLAGMSLPDRATIANMAPEYGATMGFFPVDGVTLDYLRQTGRDEGQIRLVESYCKAQGLWREDGVEATYSRSVELDMGEVEPSLAGPKRPQDRIALSGMKRKWTEDVVKSFGKSGGSRGSAEVEREVSEGGVAVADAGAEGVQVHYEGQDFTLKHGAVVIAAITSCTNTSNPSVMLAAGLVAKKAAERGLKVKPWVKTSLAPGSRVVTDYYAKAGLTEALDAMGFNLVGYGCTTCIGNSGPLPDPIARAVEKGDLVVTSVLSGNRNFEGRVNPHVKANYLASPPLVVAYALAGTVDIDLPNEALGKGTDGRDVYLKDIWPSSSEIAEVLKQAVRREDFVQRYSDVEDGPEEWQAIETATSELYPWDEDSTYIRNPPFFETMGLKTRRIEPLKGARCLAKLGDSVTTDHISPAGSIPVDGPAGRYLISRGVDKRDFNSFGSRRGNHEVMMRGTFANIRIRNQLVPGVEGGMTKHQPSGEVMAIYDAAMRYRDEGVGLVILAGKDYGMGSSRDWAAKGTYLLGVKAVIAESYERIHRSNLVGMGVLPLEYRKGETAASLGLTGQELFTIEAGDDVKPGQELRIRAMDPAGVTREFTARCRIDSQVEVEYYRNGGILHTVLREIAKKG